MDSRSRPDSSRRSRGSTVRRALSLVAAVVMVALMAAPAALAQGGQPSITVTSPTQGQKITTTDITLHVQTSNIDTSCQWVGTPDHAGQGNIHVFLDKASLGDLINVYCGTNTIVVPGEGITPGKHTLLVDLASNTHGDMLNTAQKVNIDYEPTTPKALPAASTSSAAPTVKIVSPQNGATINGQTTLQVSWTNFTPDCNLEGKPPVQGYGHLHVMIDMGKGPASEPLAGLVDMPCTSSIPLDLSGWPSGQHTITVALAQDDHTPVPGTQAATITVNLNSTAGEVLPQTGHPQSGATVASLMIPTGLAVFGLVLIVGGVTLLRRRTQV